jgi:hypothetical protein
MGGRSSGGTEMARTFYDLPTLADEQLTGPCASCGQEAAFIGVFEGRPEFFCCACNLEIVGEVDPNCNCEVCEAERVRVQIEIPDCTCEICVQWRSRRTRH